MSATSSSGTQTSHITASSGGRMLDARGVVVEQHRHVLSSSSGVLPRRRCRQRCTSPPTSPWSCSAKPVPSEGRPYTSHSDSVMTTGRAPAALRRPRVNQRPSSSGVRWMTGYAGSMSRVDTCRTCSGVCTSAVSRSTSRVGGRTRTAPPPARRARRTPSSPSARRQCGSPETGHGRRSSAETVRLLRHLLLLILAERDDRGERPDRHGDADEAQQHAQLVVAELGPRLAQRADQPAHEATSTASTSVASSPSGRMPRLRRRSSVSMT